MRFLAFLGISALAACAADSDPWTVKGEIPFDGKFVYQSR